MAKQIEPQSKSQEPLVGYKITLASCPGWLFAGVTPAEVGRAVQNEIESLEGLDPDEIDPITIEPFHITQHEIDTMPEFPGW